MDLEVHFKTLGLKSGASWDEVKGAFRRLARTYHPDIAGPEGAPRFAEITRAYMCLKEVVAPGAQRASGPASRDSRGAARQGASSRHSNSMGDTVVTVTAKIGSLFRNLFGKKEPVARSNVSSSGTRGTASEAFRGRASDVFGNAAQTDRKARSAGRGRSKEASSANQSYVIEDILDRTEKTLESLLKMRDEARRRNENEDFLFRLGSRHPAVVLLALEKLKGKPVPQEYHKCLMEQLSKRIAPTEVLMALLALYPIADEHEDVAWVLAGHATGYDSKDAILVLRWLRRQPKMRRLCAAAFLSHPSSAVVSYVLNMWLIADGPLDSKDILNLFSRIQECAEDEIFLVPLLRVLKRNKLPAWAFLPVEKLAWNHPSANVRTWALAIVRDRNIG